MSATEPAPESASQTSVGVFFERVLLPHRSLPPRAFHLLMLFLAIVSVGASIAFLVVGAWPVCGFFGLDVALLYLAFRISYRRARMREELPESEDVQELVRFIETAERGIVK